MFSSELVLPWDPLASSYQLMSAAQRAVVCLQCPLARVDGETPAKLAEIAESFVKDDSVGMSELVNEREYDYKTTSVSVQWLYIGWWVRVEVNLPGTEDTVIKQAVPPGGDSALHSALLKPAIPQTGGLGCIIFGRGGLRSRIP